MNVEVKVSRERKWTGGVGKERERGIEGIKCLVYSEYT